MERSRLVLAGLLQLLAVLYAVWFYGDRQYTLALLVFALPPILLMIGVMARRRTAAFWAGAWPTSPRGWQADGGGDFASRGRCRAAGAGGPVRGLVP